MSLLGGGANIRLGHWWAPNAGSHNKFTYPEANATSLARVADALTLFNGTATPMVAPVDLVDGFLVAATGAAFVRYLPQSQFAGIELANEPDISTFKGDYTRYTNTLNMWVTALEAAGVTSAVDAPVLASTAWWPEMPIFLNTFAPRLRAFTQHRYGLSACSHIPPTPDALMRVIPTWTTVNDSMLLAAVSNAGLPFVIGEGNSVSCNGSMGVSDVFASALYAIDASLSALAVNATSFKWHGIGDESDFFFYQPIYYKTTYLRTPDWDEAEPRPLFLGLWAFSEAAPAGSVLLNSSVNTSGSDLLRAWALRDAGDTRTTVIILHKDSNATAAHARVQVADTPCKLGTRATLTRLLSGAGGLSARSGSTWANLSFDGTSDGRPIGTRVSENVPCNSDGMFEFDVLPISAAVLSFM